MLLMGMMCLMVSDSVPRCSSYVYFFVIGESINRIQQNLRINKIQSVNLRFELFPTKTDFR